jgi:hypothetical protein
MAPLPCASIRGRTALQHRKALSRLTSIWLSQVSSVMVAGSPGSEWPTLLTRRAGRARAGTSAPSAGARAVSSTCGSAPPTAAPARRGAAAPGRARSTSGGRWRCCRGPSTKRWPPSGRGRARRRGGASTRGAKASRAPSPRPCAPSRCGRRRGWAGRAALAARIARCFPPLGSHLAVSARLRRKRPLPRSTAGSCPQPCLPWPIHSFQAGSYVSSADQRPRGPSAPERPRSPGQQRSGLHPRG